MHKPFTRPVVELGVDAQGYEEKDDDEFCDFYVGALQVLGYWKFGTRMTQIEQIYTDLY